MLKCAWCAWYEPIVGLSSIFMPRLHLNMDTMTQIRLPENLVQHVARDLLRRAQIITVPLHSVREISPAPLPLDELRTQYPKAHLEQWRMVAQRSAPEKTSLLHKLNLFAANKQPTEVAWMDLEQRIGANEKPQLLLAPFVLEGLDAADVLTALAQLPSWFAADGVLLFATLGAGAAPELVNRDPDWLAHFQHLPSIMNLGRRLQDLRFGLPVLDVETVRLGYDGAATLWQDVAHISPSLQMLPQTEQNEWRARLTQAFDGGLRELSLDIIYGQVWQPSAAKVDDGTRTVSLESLTASLKNRSEGNP